MILSHTTKKQTDKINDSHDRAEWVFNRLVEVPFALDTAWLHLQCFVVFKNKNNLSRVKDCIPGAQFERSKQTVAKTSDFGKKEWFHRVLCA